MLNRYIIVDDFYGNPDQLVEVALNSVKKEEEESPLGNYAGIMTKDYFLGPES